MHKDEYKLKYVKLLLEYINIYHINILYIIFYIVIHNILFIPRTILLDLDISYCTLN